MYFNSGTAQASSTSHSCMYSNNGSTQGYTAGVIASLSNTQSRASGIQDRTACLYIARQSTNNFQFNSVHDVTSSLLAGYNFNNANYYTGGPVTSTANYYTGGPVTSHANYYTGGPVTSHANYYTAGGPVTSHAHSMQSGNSWNGGQLSLPSGQYSSTSHASSSNATFNQPMTTGLQPANQKESLYGQSGFMNRQQSSLDTPPIFPPSCQFASNAGHNSWPLSHLSTQGQHNGDVRAQSQHQMMPAQYFNRSQQGQTAPSQINPSIYYDPAYIPQTQSNSAPVFHQGVSKLVTQAPCGPVASFSQALPSPNNSAPVTMTGTYSTVAQQIQDAILVVMPQTGQPAKKGTRPPLSPKALDAMSAWFEDNQHHPYPSKENYKSFVAIGGTTYSQAVKWFSNRRLRTGTCKSIPEYVQGRLVKPAKPAESGNHVPISIKRKRSPKNSSNGDDGPNPVAKKARNI